MDLSFKIPVENGVFVREALPLRPSLPRPIFLMAGIVAIAFGAVLLADCVGLTIEPPNLLEWVML